METLIAFNQSESAWQSWLKTICFLLPALVVWQFAAVSLFPKLQLVWRDGGAVGSNLQWLEDLLGFWMRNGGWICALLFAGLLLLEFTSRSWSRYRRVVLGSLALLTNTAIMTSLAAMCLAA